MNYKHTQIGYLILYTLFATTLLYTFILIQTNFNKIVLVTILSVTLILASFSTLKVTINKTNLQIKFGYGIYKKNFPLKTITSVKTVKNHWYYGWGIRIWFWPSMRIYNISGFDAIEIKTKNNQTYRIGTDEPKKLEHALLQSIKKHQA